MPQPSSEQDDKAAEAGAEEQDRIDEWGAEALQSAEATGGWDKPQSHDLDDEWPMPGGGDAPESAAGASGSLWGVPPSVDSQWDAPPSKPVASSKPGASSWGSPKTWKPVPKDGEGNSALRNIFWLWSGGSGRLRTIQEQGLKKASRRHLLACRQL